MHPVVELSGKHLLGSFFQGWDDGWDFKLKAMEAITPICSYEKFRREIER
jgi:hypothetical protein